MLTVCRIATRCQRRSTITGIIRFVSKATSGVRHKLALVGLGVALAAASAGCGGAEGETQVVIEPPETTIPPVTIDATLAAEPDVLRITVEPTVAAGLLRVAAARGLFGQQGLSAHISSVSAPAETQRALAAGTADAAVVSTEDALSLAESGLPIRIVLLLTSSAAADAILARPGVDGVAGLSGRRVAYVPGSGGDLLLRVALAENAVVPMAVQLVPVAARESGLLLGRGAVDAEVVTGAGSAAALALAPDLVTLYAAGDRPGLLAQVLVVREDVMRDRPGQLLALVRTWQALYALEREQPQAIAAALAAVNRWTPERAATELPGSTVYDLAANGVDLLPGGEYYDTTISTVSAIATQAGLIHGRVDPRALIDGSFVQAVASAR